MKALLLTLGLAGALTTGAQASYRPARICDVPSTRPTPTQNVPDAGSATALMSISVAGLSWLSRKVKSAKRG